MSIIAPAQRLQQIATAREGIRKLKKDIRKHERVLCNVVASAFNEVSADIDGITVEDIKSIMVKMSSWTFPNSNERTKEIAVAIRQFMTATVKVATGK